MILDMHTMVGHFPFRKTPYAAAGELARHLRQNGIGRAVTYRLHAVFYRNVQDGNEELAQELSKDASASCVLIPACVVNPAYPGWREDFRRCVDNMGFRMLVMFPAYHGYALDDPEALALLDLAGQNGVPVHLPFGLEDIRQRHPLDAARNLSVDEVCRALAVNKHTDILLSNGPMADFAQRLEPLQAQRPGRLFYDFSKLDPLNSSFDTLLQLAGPERVVFASTSPLYYIAPQTFKLHLVKEEQTRRLLSWENGKALLGLPEGEG